LLTSLALTLIALSLGAALSGGLASPVLPLLFAPVVVGFAAFARTRQSAVLLGIALVARLLLELLTPLTVFPALPAPAVTHMMLVSATASLALLAVGVIGLVDAHSRIARELERMRIDMLKEAEDRAASVEHLGAQVAHEVKNPLTAVRGLAQLAQRRASDAKDQERLAVVVSEVDRALELLHGYLSFARPLRALALAEVELRALLEDVAGVLEARAHERRVRIELIGLETRVVADRKRLRDALLNLALNAIAAMPDGGTLSLRVAPGTDGAMQLQIADTGVGMSAELLAQIGEPFATAAEGGTGLGVLAARGVATQHGGALRFESVPDRGTTAVLELPPSCRTS
jgi:signal transduction histidine kinase